MIPSRSLARTALGRAARTAHGPRCRQVRFQSTSTATAGGAAASGSSPFAAGVAGGVASSLLLYGIYYVSPAGKTARTINYAAKEANDKYQAAAKKLQESTPNADEAIDSVKQFAYSYAGWIPGGRAYVDTAFKDIETIRENQREQADELVRDARKQLAEVSKAGLSLAALSKAYDVLTDLSQKAANLAGDAFSDLVDNHPKLKEKLGDNMDQLKQLSEQYGPEAKKQIDKTWHDVKDIMAGGFSSENLEKAREAIDNRVQEVKKLGDEAWDKGLKEAKQYLDKNPKIKELVEKNADALKRGDAKELFTRAKSAVESGDAGELEKYIKGAVDKAKSQGFSIPSGWGDLDQYAKKIPGGEEMLPKLQKLREVADKHKDEGEKLLNETIEELKQVLEKKAKKAEELAGKVKQDAK
ncbi:hypothetical protein GQ53DRAFT_746416 [Thozetella sp. PMI_491]|nr:hypothetical protein GQ53DRAFT_746416 [Thozetella sp. PMI_491]